MSARPSTFSNALVAIAVICAVLTTGMMVRREFFARAVPGEEPVHLDANTWRDAQATGQRIGPAFPAVTVVVFSDFECPSCRNFANRTWAGLRARYPNDVALVFRHWPLDYHRFAYPAARAAECAGAQGRFEQFHNAVFAKQDSLGLKSFVSFAVDAEVGDTARFLACNSISDSVPHVNRDIAAVMELGGSGTPTVIVNGIRYINPPDSVQLDQLVQAALRAAGKVPHDPRTPAP